MSGIEEESEKDGLSENTLIGSEETMCVICRKKLYISPTSKKIIEERKAEVICWPCLNKTDDEKDFRLTREQVSEIMENLELKKRGEEEGHYGG